MLIFAGIIGLYAGFVNHVQNVLSVIVVDGLHFDPAVLHTLIDAFWYVTFHGAIILIIFLTLYALPARPDPKNYTKKKLLLSSIGISFLAWFSIIIYVRILMLIQATLVTRMSIFYGSLAFIPLILFLVFGIWTIVLCGNSIVWTICTWPESRDRIWNWEGSPTEGLNMTKDRL